MRKFHLLLTALVIIGLFLATTSCRKEFLTDFPDVEVINAPPTSKVIPDQSYRAGFETARLDLSAYFFDQEADPLTYTTSSSDPAVVTVSTEGNALIVAEKGIGMSTITISATDGNEGNETSQEFTITVEDLPPIEYAFIIDFEQPDGTSENDITAPGATLNFEGSGGSFHIIQGGVLEWTTDEYSGMSIEFDEPLDLSENSELQFDYANLWSEELIILFEDANGNFSQEIIFEELDIELEIGNPNFTKLTGFFLEDYAENTDEGFTVDMSAITFIYFEKFGGAEDGSTSWKIDNFGIGPMEPSDPFKLYLDFDYPDGDANEVIESEDFTIEFEGSEGSTQEIQNGVLVWTITEYSGMFISLNEPIDLTENSEVVFDYADLWSTDLIVFFEDSEGNASPEIFLGDEGFDFELNNPNFTTFDQGFQLKDHAENVDMSSIQGIYFEKFEGLPDGSTVVRLDNLGIGKIE